MSLRIRFFSFFLYFKSNSSHKTNGDKKEKEDEEI
jgi:hypothetical protein